ITYTITDNEGGTDTATVTVTVTGTNDAPVSTPLGNLTNDDADVVSVDVSGSFSDPDATDVLTFSATGLPPGLTIDPASGVISGTIAPNASVTGPYTVIVTATDPSGATTSETYTWTVNNPAPDAVDDVADVIDGEPTVIDVLANDRDGGGDIDELTVVSASAEHGVVTINPDGTITYEPAYGYEGEDVIVVEISDGEGGFATAVVTLKVTAQPFVQASSEQSIPVSPKDQPSMSFESVDGIVLDTVESIRSRHSAGTVSAFDNDGALQPYDVRGLSSFGLRMQRPGAEQVTSIETFVRDQVLMIALLSDAGFEKGDIEWKVQQANGMPLPDWMSFVGEDMLMGIRAANDEYIDLRITEVRPDGTSVTHEVRVQTVTGEIQPLKIGRSGMMVPAPFWQQFGAAEHPDEDDRAYLAGRLAAGN
ncbi:MAG: cadherin-like domain-containing protein, partial [Hyphomicrobiaceae bacterium]|nr:cadherin-like domain-containing protein [Hyphomicrobiaceae bacterium]